MKNNPLLGSDKQNTAQQVEIYARGEDNDYGYIIFNESRNGENYVL